MNVQIGEWILGHQTGNYRHRDEFALFRVLSDGMREVVYFRGETCEIERLKPDEEISEPSFCLLKDQMQAFMETFWEMGYRPKGRRFENEMDLQGKHLEDMRRIAFKLLEPPAAPEIVVRDEY